jgi:hypothetical protein
MPLPLVYSIAPPMRKVGPLLISDEKVLGHLRSRIRLCGRGSLHRKTPQLSPDIGSGGEGPWSASSKRRRRSHAPGAEAEAEAEAQAEAEAEKTFCLADEHKRA